MPRIWCAITAHGYGHAAQTVPILNELGRRIPNLSALLRTTVPPKFFQARLTIPWEWSPLDQGGGCVQEGPLHIDIPRTWSAYQEFHENWEGRIEKEVAAIKSYAPTLILSNISYLALEAGMKADVPAVALASLSWDEVMQGFLDPGNGVQASLLTNIRNSYRCSTLLIRMKPGLALSAFPNKVDVGPIGHPPLQPSPRTS